MDKIITPVFRLSFPALFLPKPGPNGGDPRYSLNMLFTKDTDLSLLKAGAKAAATEKWGATMPKGLRTPFRLGDEKDYDGYAGMIYVNAWSKSKPRLVDQSVQDILNQEELYAGCYCIASIRAFAYEGKNAQGAILSYGVSFGLMNVQKVKDGAPFGNRSDPKDDFVAVAKAEQAQGKSAAAEPAADDWM